MPATNFEMRIVNNIYTKITAHWNGNVPTKHLWHWQWMMDRRVWYQKGLTQWKLQGRKRVVKVNWHFYRFARSCFFLSKRGRGGPSGKSAGGDRQPERVQDCNIFLAPASNIQGVWKTLGSSLNKLGSRLFEVLERLPNKRIIIIIWFWR